MMKRSTEEQGGLRNMSIVEKNPSVTIKCKFCPRQVKFLIFGKTQESNERVSLSPQKLKQ